MLPDFFDGLFVADNGPFFAWVACVVGIGLLVWFNRHNMDNSKSDADFGGFYDSRDD